MFVSDIGSWKLWKTSSGTHKLVSPNANTQQEHIPDMVPTPITKHSTRASKVKAGPSTAIPWAMLSLTSSWKHMSDISVSPLLLGCGNKNQNIIVHTWELELKANLARAHALERSMRSRKKGKASLKDRIKLFIARFWKSSWKKGPFYRVCPYLRPVSSLSRKWMTTVLNTKLEKMVKRPAMPTGNADGVRSKGRNITGMSYKHTSTDT